MYIQHCQSIQAFFSHGTTQVSFKYRRRLTERSHSALVTKSVQVILNSFFMFRKKSPSATLSELNGLSRLLASSALPCHLTVQQCSLVNQTVFRAEKVGGGRERKTVWPNSLVPRLSPSSFFFFYVRMRNRTEGESLGWFDHVRTLMTRSVSIVINIIL